MKEKELFNCVDCGTEIYRRTKAHKRCETCARNREREQDAERARKKRLAKGMTSIGTEANCSWCGSKFTVDRSGGVSFCSPECKEAKKKQDNKDWYFNKSKENGLIPQEATSKTIICKICNEEKPCDTLQQSFCFDCKENRKEDIKDYERKLSTDRAKKRRAKNGIVSLSHGRVCVICEAEFIPNSPLEKYCSQECRREGKNQYQANFKLTKNPDAIIYRNGVYVECERCSIKLFTKSAARKYCEDCSKIINKEKQRARGSESQKRWKRKNPDYETKRKESDPKFAIRVRMRHLMNAHLRSRNLSKNGKTWESLVGYTIKDLYEHLESNFLPGMTWENRNEWHIDHLICDSSFNYSSYDDEGFKKSWALENLRPLWAEWNLEKSNKTDWVMPKNRIKKEN